MVQSLPKLQENKIIKVVVTPMSPKWIKKLAQTQRELTML